MAARVRFLSLSLAGFGRYDRPTRFVLDGHSCSFTSGNELGKSTFHAGLVATLFGPPPIRAKLQLFQERFRSWNKPPWFWGELEFGVSDERWRVRREFESGDVKVWRLSSDGFAELRYEERVRGRKPTEPDPYERLLEDWLGIGDRSLYEAMFIVSQDTSLATAWQIDPGIAERVYGPAVKRLSDNLQEFFDRFREITRNTREFQVSLGGQGERNGRNDGRLDLVVARIAELESHRAAAHERTQLIAEHRTRLVELDGRCDTLRTESSRTTQSLDHWRAWRDLESRLRPAVESYERLHEFNDRCQQVRRPLAELRSRLAGSDIAVFDDAPDDVAERLEYYPLLIQAADDARNRQVEQQSLGDWLRGELAHWQEQLATEFADYRGRPALADQVEELRLVRDEIATVQNRLRELTDAAKDPGRDEIEQQLVRLGGWRRLGPDWADRLADARRAVDAFAAAHAEFQMTKEVAGSETQWLAEQSERIAAFEHSRCELAATREHERAEIAAAVDQARTKADAGRQAKQKIEGARAELDRRYVDFVTAPSDLLELWDELHAIQSRQTNCRARIDRARESLEQLDRRTYWRRGLTAIGVCVTLICLLWGRGWVGWFGVAAAAGIATSLRWIYRVHPADADDARRSLQAAEADHTMSGRDRDAVAEKLGPRFVVPPEREAEWRRLWPAYRREFENIETEARSVPAGEQIAEFATQATACAARLEKLDDETEHLLADSDEQIARAKAEAERRALESRRLQEQLVAHLERFFGTSGDDWPARSITVLPDSWRPVLDVATPSESPRGCEPTSVDDLVAWCQSLDDAAWQRFADACREVERLHAQLTPDAAADAAHEAAVRDAEELLQSLEQQQFRLSDAIAPFTADSDVGWLRERALACEALETKIARRELELGEMATPESLANAVQQAAVQLADAAAILRPLLDRFDHDPARVIEALTDRAELARQVRELDSRAAAVVAESGFASLEELAHESGRAEGLVGTIRAESQELLSKAIELWDAVDAPSELAVERCRLLEARQTEQQATLAAAERERADLAATIRQLESDPAADESAIQTELNLLRSEQLELENRRDQLAAEFQETNRLMQELKRVERTALEGRITAYFADFSRTPGRRVELDEELRIRLRNDDGTRYAPDQLSHGARDQLYLAVYFATTAGLDLPFILDDPFVNCDTERLAAIRACWDRLIPDHQLILLSHDPHLASWAPALEMREAA